MIDTVALLLADPSPALRYRALVDVDGASEDDPEVVALRAELLESPEAQEALLAASAGDDTHRLSFTLSRLAYLGIARGHPAVDDVAERIFRTQKADGSWPSYQWFSEDLSDGSIPHEGWKWRPLQVALPLRGLCASGYATDPRSERAFEWLLERQLDDGALPYGLGSGGHEPALPPGYRRLPNSQGCRTTTTGFIACIAHHPQRRTSDDARAAMSVLMGRETREEASIGVEVARLTGVEKATGFATFYARWDLAYLLDLASRIGVSVEDRRMSDLVAFIESRRGRNGLWRHPSHPHLSRWLTLDLLSSLRRLGDGDWIGSEQRLSFTAYPKRRKRY